MSGAAGGRRAARERALGLLYEAATKEQPVDEVIAALEVRPDEFAVEIVRGVEVNTAALDAVIARFARGWSLERMPLLDLTVLRMATFELTERLEIPTAAVISEAVELAKKFSTDNSGRFVNGVLSSIAGDVRGEGDRDRP
jgi:transcription antitermination protein NusB